MMIGGGGLSKKKQGFLKPSGSLRQKVFRVNRTEYQDTLYLVVKMLLSEVRTWASSYKFPSYVCTHFSKVLFDKMTVQGVRCGYVIVTFQNDTSHAIVAFDTLDHGLIYLEPQDGCELRIEVGKEIDAYYAGVEADTIVTKIDISWNDKMFFEFYECPVCGYILPYSVKDPCDSLARSVLCPINPEDGEMQRTT